MQIILVLMADRACVRHADKRNEQRVNKREKVLSFYYHYGEMLTASITILLLALIAIATLAMLESGKISLHLGSDGSSDKDESSTCVDRKMGNARMAKAATAGISRPVRDLPVP